MRNNDKYFERLTRMYVSEFEQLLEELEYLRFLCAHIGTKLMFENIILLVFIWLVKYCDYSVLETLFGTSKAVVGNLIDFLLPELAAFFLGFIADEIRSLTSSVLSKRIIAVIDSTIHATQKPRKSQHLHYNDHYKRHGMMTTLLVDFDGFIISVSTGGIARLHVQHIP